LLTFLNIVFRLLKLVLYELENGRFVEVLDRKNRLENTHDAFAVHWLRLIAGPKKKVIGRFLNLNKVRHLKNFTNFTVVLAKTFLAEKGRCHRI